MKIPRGFDAGLAVTNSSLSTVTQSADQNLSNTQRNWQQEQQTVRDAGQVWAQVAREREQRLNEERAKKEAVDKAINDNRWDTEVTRITTDQHLKNTGPWSDKNYAEMNQELAKVVATMPPEQQAYWASRQARELQVIRANGVSRTQQIETAQRKVEVGRLVNEALRSGDPAQMKALSEGPVKSELTPEQEDQLFKQQEYVKVMDPLQTLLDKGDIAGAKAYAEGISQDPSIPVDRSGKYVTEAWADINRAEAEVKQIEADNAATAVNNTADLKYQIYSGARFTKQQLEEAHQMGLLGDPSKSESKKNLLALSEYQDKVTKDERKAAQGEADVSYAMANPAGGVAPTADQKRDFYEKHVGSGVPIDQLPPDKQAIAVDMVLSNQKPPQMDELLAVGITGDQPELTKAAFSLWQLMAVHAPHGLAATSEQRAVYDNIAVRVQNGESFESARIAALTPLKPEDRKAFARQYREDKQTKPEVTAKWLGNTIQNDTQIGGDGIVVNASLVSDFEILTRYYYERNRGNLEQARSSAYNDIRGSVYHTTVNGYDELMHRAPEYMATPNMVTPQDATYYRKDVLESAKPHYDMATEDVFIRPIPGATDGPGGPPVYFVMKRPVGGSPGSVGEHVLDKDSLPLLWKPDYAKYRTDTADAETALKDQITKDDAELEAWRAAHPEGGGRGPVLPPHLIDAASRANARAMSAAAVGPINTVRSVVDMYKGMVPADVPEWVHAYLTPWDMHNDPVAP